MKNATAGAIMRTVNLSLNPHTQGEENRPELSASPNSHLAIPFQHIRPGGSSAQGQPQRTDPEPQGQRQVLSETEKPTGLQLWDTELGILLPLLCSLLRPPGLSVPS